MPAGYLAAFLRLKPAEMFVSLKSLKYTLCRQVDDHVDIFLNELIEFYLNNMVHLHPLTPHVVSSYTPKNGDYILTVDFVTSFHPMWRSIPL